MEPRPVAPRYLIHERLGEGGMGEVWLGTLISPAGERRVAIKRLSPARALDPEAQERLVAEARLAFRLTHANVCQVLDLGDSDQGTFVVMELVDGMDLRALLDRLRARGERLELPAALHAAREVARALDYAHRRADAAGRPLGVVHGDVTPGNVLLSVEGEVKLCDFGVARAREGVTAPGKQLRGGTPGYAAPEGSGDHRGDLYALGATLWVALAGDDPAAPRLEPGRLAARRPDVPPELDALVARAAAERPEARFLSAGELAQALSTLLARRWPGWTPADLGRLVQRHRHAPAPAAEVTGQVRSLALGSIDDRDRPTVAARPTPRPSVGDDAPRERTATFDPAAPRPPEADSSGAPEQTATFAPADALGIAAAPTAILDPPKGEGIAAGPTVIFDAPDDDGLGAPPTGIVAAPTAIRRRAGAGAWAVALLLVAGAATGLGLAVRARGHRSDDAREAPAAAPDSSRADSERAPDDPASHSPPPAAPAETQEVRRELARPIRLPPGVVRTLRDRRATLARARPTEGPRGFLTVSSTPWGAVFVDGKQVADETPLYRMPLPPGEHQVAVRFANSQRSSPPRRVRVAAGAVATVGFVQ